MPLSETAVMLVTVVVTVATHNLAYRRRSSGVLVAMVVLRPPRRPPHRGRRRRATPTRTPGVYAVTGELFFASSNDLYTQFDYADDPDEIVIDLSDSHIWDASTVATLDAITHKYEAKNKSVRIVGLNASSADRHERLTGQLSGH